MRLLMILSLFFVSSAVLVAAPMEEVGVDSKFFGAVLAAFIVFVSSQIVLIKTIKSQREMLERTIEGNRILEEEKASRDYSNALRIDKRKKLLDVVKSVTNAQAFGSEDSRYLFVISDGRNELNESYRNVVANLQTAKSISSMYFPELLNSLTDLEVPLKDFRMSIDNHIISGGTIAKDDWRDTAREQARLLEKQAEIVLTNAAMYAVELRVERTPSEKLAAQQ